MAVRHVILVLLAISVLAGCGRRPAQLDTPYQAALEARAEAQRNNQPLPPEPTPPVADKPFILDPLL